MKRYVIVGAGLRCYTMFVEHLTTERYRDTVALTGVYDPNRTRSRYFQDKVGPELHVYDDFEDMLETEQPDGVIIASTDHTHHDYIVRALDRGYDVVCEKPITNTLDRCLAIRQAEKRSGKEVAVTFNCRFMPHFAKLKELISGGIIGKIHAVNYEYCLDRVHGGDYFKRWHRKMEFSQGMLLHKSTHHFDIINWLLEDEPRLVTALGVQSYYANGEKAAANRCTRCPIVDTCLSAGSWDAKSSHEIYYAAEHEDGYIRDTCCFLPDADIMDNLSVNVRYEKGALLTYSLNLFSMHEGYRLSFAGENGILTLESWSDDGSDQYEFRVVHADGTKETISVDKSAGAHAGGDERLIAMLFGGERNDPLGQCADSFAGFSSAIIGIGANESMAWGTTVNLKHYLDQLR
jgi:predicted dehydrogenase